MQCIKVQYVGHTNTKPAHLIAECDAGKVRYKPSVTGHPDNDSRMAAAFLMNKLGWNTYLKIVDFGSFKNNDYFILARI